MTSTPPPPWSYIAKLVCIGDSGCGKSSLTIRLCEGRFVTHHDVTIGVEFGSRIVPVGPPHSKRYYPGGNTAAASLSAATTPGSATPTSFASTPAPLSSISGKLVEGDGSGGLPDPPRQKPKEPEEPQKHMKLSLWDTAGQETYKSVTRSYFRGASGALLVFDLSRKHTFLHVKDWLDDLRQIADPDIVVVLVGNKADLTGVSETGSDDGPANTTNQRQVTREEAQEWAQRNGVLEYVETSAKSGENVEHAFLRVADRIYQNIQAGRYDLNDRRSGVKGSSSAANAASAASAGRGGLRLDQNYYQKSNGCC